MKIAIIGAGISGLTAAYVLQRNHEVELFEANDYVGGHTCTVDVEQHGRSYAVDTGFVVFNRTTYPNFIQLLDQLGVGSQDASMSFSVRCDETGLEYAGTSLNSLFAQRSNLFNLAFYRMLFDITRFNRAASRAAGSGEAECALGEFLARSAPSSALRNRYVVPLISAIWSLDPDRVGDFPASFFLRFAERHRLLQVRDQLKWRVICGGSREYVRKLVERLDHDVQTRTPVREVRRMEQGVEVVTAKGENRAFDRVVMAVHSDQALRLLDEASEDEQELLGAIRYQSNSVVLHTDRALMPENRRAWANWNYRIPSGQRSKPITTYNMSGLQGLDSPTPILVTLNDDERIDPGKIIRRDEFAHPIYTNAVVEAQKRRGEISGVRRTHYCGAYWGYGFHEDGVSSALAVAAEFGQEL